jgi:hypothetical protein
LNKSRVFNVLALLIGLTNFIWMALPVALLSKTTCGTYGCNTGDGDAMANFYQYAFGQNGANAIIVLAISFVMMVIGLILTFIALFGERYVYGMSNWKIALIVAASFFGVASIFAYAGIPSIIDEAVKISSSSYYATATTIKFWCSGTTVPALLDFCTLFCILSVVLDR